MGSSSGGFVTCHRSVTTSRAGSKPLRRLVAEVLLAERPALAGGTATTRGCWRREATASRADDGLRAGGTGGSGGYDDSELAASSEEDEAERGRLIALVELARQGDAEAFGLLYDHYQGSVYRFLFYRTRSSTLAEDLTSETFFRALRSMNGFRWQGKDFGAWLMTIARNLATDHFKAGRTRLELTTEDMSLHDDATDGPEGTVLAGLTNEVLMQALTELPAEQRDCLVMRFLQGMSIAETAAVLGPQRRRRQAAPAPRGAQPRQADAGRDPGLMARPSRDRLLDRGGSAVTPPPARVVEFDMTWGFRRNGAPTTSTALVERASTGELGDARSDRATPSCSSSSARSAASPNREPRPEFVADLRSRLMAEAETALVPTDVSRLQLPARRTGRERRIAAVVGGLAIVGATTSVAVASQSALPGESLYPIKRVIESAHTGLSVGEARKGSTELANASSRLDEVAALTAGRRPRRRRADRAHPRHLHRPGHLRRRPAARRLRPDRPEGLDRPSCATSRRAAWTSSRPSSRRSRTPPATS